MLHRVNFSIPDCNFNLLPYDPSSFIKQIPKKDGRQTLEEVIFVFRKGRLDCLIQPKYIDEASEWIKDKILNDPDWADELYEKTTKINKEYFKYTKKISKIDFANESNESLLAMHEKLRDYQRKGHTWAVSTTWFMESNGEIYSSYIKNRLEEHLKNKGINDLTTIMEYYTVLTTPIIPSMAHEEQIAFLEMAQSIEKDSEVIKIFKEKTNASEVYCALEEDLKNKLKEHHNEWSWMQYQYIGPAYTLEHYIEELQKIFANHENISNILLEEKKRYPIIKESLELLLHTLELSSDLDHYFSIARDLVWLKDYRKMCLFHGHWAIDLINKEIAKRLHLTIKQVNLILDNELKDALIKGEFDQHLLNLRDSLCVMKTNENDTQYYIGRQAEEFYKTIEIEKIETSHENQLKGTCASPGKVIGPVSIVNSVDDIKNVKKGDIMVTHVTYPSYLPAMKRAAAFINEDGGITTHVAIVAREFKKPCIVGITKAREILQNGDIVEVDATSGIVIKQE